MEYIRKSPDATIMEIISATGVSLKSIDCLVEDGFVSYKDNKLKEIDDETISNISKFLNKNKFHLRRDDL